jgi:hypothetical protein
MLTPMHSRCLRARRSSHRATPRPKSLGRIPGPARTGIPEPLDDGARRFVEGRTGWDLRAVRVHRGENGANLATALGARAATSADEISFAPGFYQPGRADGRRMLVHELTHTVQQRTAGAGLVQAAGLGEMWDALWGVGPIDALKAKSAADRALAAAQATGLPGLHNGPADAWRHCYWNCLLTDALGRDQAKTIADNHEAHGGGPAHENTMDLFNNEQGRACGGTACDSCCQGKLDAGQLRVIGPGNTVVPSSLTARTGGAQAGQYYQPAPPRAPREWPTGCFVGDTPVLMADGTERPIGLLRPGDRVAAWDLATGDCRACEVTRVIRHVSSPYLRVRLEGDVVLEVTAGHPIWVGDAWRHAGELGPGDVVYARGAVGLVPVAVLGSEPAASPQAVFDLTVSGCHTFFARGVLAHNKNI